MINKLDFQSIVNKYYLGENESVKWVIKDNHLTIDFMSPNQEVIGKVQCLDFPLQDSELAIFDTKKLTSLINITSGKLLLELEQQKAIFTKLKISDENFNLTYALSDPFLFGKVGTVNEQEYDISLMLEVEDVEALIKAKSALLGVDNMKINTTRDIEDELVCKFIFGDEDGHNNKITYQIKGEIGEEDLNLPFNSNMFKNILYANKDMEKGILKISSTGLMCLEFKSNKVLSEYYMIRKADENF